MTINDIAENIHAHPHIRKPILIAIDGFGGAGKSTLAEKLKVALGHAYVVNIDDFIVKEKVLELSWNKGGFDRKRLKLQVLKPLKTGQSAAYQKLIWQTNTLGEPVIVPDVTYVIVEGISSSHPDIASYFDYKIWVNTPIEIAKERGHVRDGSNENAQHWDLWAENDLRYQERYHPEQHADFVIDNP